MIYEMGIKVGLSKLMFLCYETKTDLPDWCHTKMFLAKPWFVSEMNSLKAMAIRDSHIAFRKNNIFVLDNFMERA